MKRRFVSILVVTFNAEKYIEKTIKSCLDQTYQNLEVLVLDNASSDRTVEIIRRLSDSRITMFEGKENIGPYAGLNFLLEKAEGEYIAIQDHDDVWFPEKIGKQVDFLNKNPNYIGCGTKTFYFYENKKVLILNKRPFETNFVDHTSLMFRNKGLGYDENFLLADEYFEKKILKNVGKLACIQEPLNVHRIRRDGTNLSSNRFNFSLKNTKEFFSINGISLQSIFYLFDLVFGKFFPNKIIWLIRKYITQNKADWMSVEEFSNLYFPI